MFFDLLRPGGSGIRGCRPAYARPGCIAAPTQRSLRRCRSDRFAGRCFSAFVTACCKGSISSRVIGYIPGQDGKRAEYVQDSISKAQAQSHQRFHEFLLPEKLVEKVVAGQPFFRKTAIRQRCRTTGSRPRTNDTNTVDHRKFRYLPLFLRRIYPEIARGRPVRLFEDVHRLTDQTGRIVRSPEHQ